MTKEYVREVSVSTAVKIICLQLMKLPTSFLHVCVVYYLGLSFLIIEFLCRFSVVIFNLVDILLCVRLLVDKLIASKCFS